MTPSSTEATVLKSDVSREASPDVSDADLTELVDGNTKFALELYGRLAGEDGSIGISPLSISTCVAMIWAGAKGETERQIAEALKFTLVQDRHHPALNRLDRELEALTQIPDKGEETGIRLYTANSLWCQDGEPIEPGFLDTMAKNYGAGLRVLDFRTDPEACRQIINTWVEDQTQGRIKDLIPGGTIDPTTILVLVNAIYFKSKWMYEFKEKATHNDDFKLLDGSTIEVPMMRQTHAFNAFSNDDLDAIELPYVGERMSMLVLAPKVGKFKEFEQNLDPAGLDEVIGSMGKFKVDLRLPKFKSESFFILNKPLCDMGMPIAFSSDADFTGISALPLMIAYVIHKVFVLVNEEGTEAAAATAILVTRSISVEPPPHRIHIDRPFIYMIRDMETGTMLFVGRILEPKQE